MACVYRRGTYRVDVVIPVFVALDYDLDADIRAVGFEELSEHLAL